jgi:hypothetical protein
MRQPASYSCRIAPAAMAVKVVLQEHIAAVSVPLRRMTTREYQQAQHDAMNPTSITASTFSIRGTAFDGWNHRKFIARIKTI